MRCSQIMEKVDDSLDVAKQQKAKDRGKITSSYILHCTRIVLQYFYYDTDISIRFDNQDRLIGKLVTRVSSLENGIEKIL